MSSESPSGYRRWADAEQSGREDDADDALRVLFSAVPRQAPTDRLRAEVASSIALAARRQARLSKAALAPAGVFAALLTLLLLPQIPRLVRVLADLSVRAVVWMILAFNRGVDVWTVLGQLARGAGALVVAPQVSLVLIACGLVAIAALYGLNRMLELEERASS